MEDRSTDTSSSSRSSTITVSSHLSSTEPDSSPQLASGSNGLQNGNNDGGGVLNSSITESAVAAAAAEAEAAAAAAAAAADIDAEFGFQRPEMRQLPLVGTVHAYDRHVFLCYKNPDVWPSHVEAAEFDRLPRLLSAALKARKSHLKKKTLLTICEGKDGTESSNGDVLIFPDMIRYRRLTHFDVDNFVEDVLVKETEWLPGPTEVLSGSYVFVCCHGSRDRRCGVCGPALIKKFEEEISSRGLQGQVSVSPCSHIGGHKYAGNTIIYSRNINGDVTGHWYGYVIPDDVSILIEQHIGKGEIVDHLWRGQMGLSGEDQRKAQELRLQSNGTTEEKIAGGSVPETDNAVNGTAPAAFDCCQGGGNISCCQNGAVVDKLENTQISDQETETVLRRKAPKVARAELGTCV